MKRHLRTVAVVVITVTVVVTCLWHPYLRGTLLTPLQTAVSSAAGWVSDRLGGVWKTRYESAQAALNEARQERIEADALQRENEWYRTFLGLKATRNDITFTAAKVIAVDAVDRFGGITVNVGSLDGITAGMPVLTADGVIGITHTVGWNWTQIRTLYHPDVTVSVTVSRTGEVGTTDGGDRDMQTVTVATLPRDSAAAVGDILVTAGIGGVYPADLPIGEIRSVERHRDGVSDIATVHTYATVGIADRVMIITSFADKLGDYG